MLADDVLLAERSACSPAARSFRTGRPLARLVLNGPWVSGSSERPSGEVLSPTDAPWGEVLSPLMPVISRDRVCMRSL